MKDLACLAAVLAALVASLVAVLDIMVDGEEAVKNYVVCNCNCDDDVELVLRWHEMRMIGEQARISE